MNWIAYVAMAALIVGAVFGGIMTAIAKKEEDKRTKYFKEVSALIEKLEMLEEFGKEVDKCHKGYPTQKKSRP